jgi:guanylate kinase
VGAGPLLIVLTGPSGVGKDTLLTELRSRGRDYYVSVNATTRPPRQDEVDGVDYYFVSKEEFRRLLNAGELLEHAEVYGQDKGVPKAPLREALAAGQDVLMRTDIQGARTIKRLVPAALVVFITPPSKSELRRRVEKRGGDSAQQVKIRDETAGDEMSVAAEFDHTVVNDDVSRAADEIESIMARERHRPGRGAVGI